MSNGNPGATQTNKATESGTILICDLKFRYPDSIQLLKKINLALSPGTWSVISGESGSGKTTLAMSLNGLVPHSTGGHIGGSVKISGSDPRSLGPAEMSKYVGFLFQETASSFIGNTIELEIAFSLEQQGIPPEKIKSEIERVLKLTRTEEFRFRSPQTLSGGERQRCALATLLALHPSVLVLDEPTAQLDPPSKKEIITLIDKIRREEGTTIVWIEQPCADTALLADHFWILKNGTLSPNTAIPSGKESTLPSTNKHRLNVIAQQTTSGENLLQLRQISFHFPSAPLLIKDLSLSVKEGEILFLKGINGSGKTTLFRIIMGLEKPQNGEIVLNNQSITSLSTAERAASIAYLMQEPDQQLFAPSVKEELMSGILYRLLPTGKKHKYLPKRTERQKNKITRKERKYQIKEIKKEAVHSAQTIASQTEITPFWETPPQQLSYGFRKRVALAAIATSRPKLYLLDEPTVALDPPGRQWLKEWILSQKNSGVSFLIISHDEEFIAETETHTITMESVNGI